MPDMHMGSYGPLTWHLLFTSWQPNRVWDVLIALALASYVGALVTANRRGLPGLPWYRVLSFLIGLLTLVVSLNTALETYSHVLFWVHMVQHLLLIMVAPALLVVGGPLRLLLQVTTGAAHERVRAGLTTGPVALLTHPLVGLALYAAIIIGTHLTSFMEQMMLHPWLHQAEHVLYLGGGYVFLLPLLGDEPIRWRLPHLVRLLALFVAMAPETVVGIVLLQAGHELFPSYAAINRTWGPTPLADLNRGGGIMWAFGDGLMMAFIVAVMLVYLARAGSNETAGGWLEGVRRQTLTDHLQSSGEPGDLGPDDLDSDDQALAAYNRMLARLHHGADSAPPSQEPDPSSR